MCWTPLIKQVRKGLWSDRLKDITPLICYCFISFLPVCGMEEKESYSKWKEKRMNWRFRMPSALIQNIYNFSHKCFIGKLLLFFIQRNSENNLDFDFVNLASWFLCCCFFYDVSFMVLPYARDPIRSDLTGFEHQISISFVSLSWIVWEADIVNKWTD